MRKAVAVIGMNFGDEGKGHITNYLSDANALNVRFNGGAQAAHGVFLSDGRNHIFHHFGSGSLRGARTLLANKFIVNPIIFSEELADLSKKTSMRETFIDPRCLVTTPYDMLINSFSAKHLNKTDTCGMGINETIERSAFRQLRIGMRTLIDKTPTQLMSVLKKISHEWVPYRLKKLNLPYGDFQLYLKKRIPNSNRVVEQYINVVKFMLNHVVVWPDDNLIDRFLAKSPDRKIVFEGAQGLLLDQNRTEYMPFLTRSNTGLKNIFKILRTVKTSIEMDAYLVSRTYLTRHGDGPLPNEFELPRENISDPSNPENPYQGKMRYGLLDIDWYEKAIKEISQPPKNIPLKNFSVGVALTCIDHMQADIDKLSSVKVFSSGPTENDITTAQPNVINAARTSQKYR